MSLPSFVSLCNVWFAPGTPAAGAPDLVNVPCQLYVPSKAGVDMEPGTVWAWVPPIYLRLPISETNAARLGKIYEVEPGTGFYYIKRWVDRCHRGFPNEYWMALLMQCTNTGFDVQRDV